MSLDFSLHEVMPVEVHSANITHNLGSMAQACGLYHVLWRPDENGIERALQAIPILKEGLELLRSKPSYFRQFDAANGWGRYEDFVGFVQEVLDACEKHPGATIEVSR